MATEPTIRDVRLDRREIRTRRGVVKDLVEATLAVANPSGKETIFVSVSLRFVSYDAEARQLTLSTASRSSPPSFRPSGYMLPTIIAIQPEKAIPIRLRVPVQLVQIRGVKERRFVTESYDLRQVARVKCQVGFGATAFRPIPKQKPDEVRRQLLEWQRVVDASFERSLRESEKQGGPGSRGKQIE
jgi:hypothetical protein